MQDREVRAAATMPDEEQEPQVGSVMNTEMNVGARTETVMPDGARKTPADEATDGRTRAEAGTSGGMEAEAEADASGSTGPESSDGADAVTGTDASGSAGAESSGGARAEAEAGTGAGVGGSAGATSRDGAEAEAETGVGVGGSADAESGTGASPGSGPGRDTESGSAAGARRRRGAALEQSILEAAWKELAEVGYPHLTMEGVAARAHTGKQVLYRRWSGRAELVVAAMRQHTGSILDDIPDTGGLRGDTFAVLHRMVERQREVGTEVFHGLLAELPTLNPEQFTILGGVMVQILRRAAARGEIGPGPVPARVATVPTDLLRHQLLLTGDQPVSEQVVTEIVDEIFLPLVHVHADATAPAAEHAPGPG
jgi:AcrR family transcriptional regulator